MNRRSLIARGLSAAGLGFASAILTSCGPLNLNRLRVNSKPQAGRVVIVGAGIAGLAAAAELQAAGWNDVVLLEARDRIGGRIWTSRIGGHPIDLGASWIHGDDGNPIAKIAAENNIQTLPTDYDNKSVYFQELSEVRPSMEHIVEGFWRYAQQRPSVTLRRLYETYVKKSGLMEEEQHYLAYVLNTAIEHEFGADIDDLSLKSITGGKTWTGRDVLFPCGYEQIVEVLATGLDIRTGHAVSEIDYRGLDVVLTTATGATIEAAFVVVTVPLGVLKKSSITFIPELPPTNQRALDGLSMGVLNKTCLLFDEVFWPPNVELIGYVSSRPGQWAETISLYRDTRRPILMMFNAGSYAGQTEEMSDDQVVHKALAALKGMFQTVPAPKEALITRWLSDSWSHGSYSYVPVGSSFRLHDELAKPIENKVFFAGEATHVEYPATVHGALLSGVRAAREITLLMSNASAAVNFRSELINGS